MKQLKQVLLVFQRNPNARILYLQPGHFPCLGEANLNGVAIRRRFDGIPA